MRQLTRWEHIRAVIAKWIVLNIAARISIGAVVALCIETADLYQKQYIEDMEAIEPNE